MNPCASFSNRFLSMWLQTGNKQKWVPLMIEVKSEGPRERSASRNNSRQNENPRLPPNARNDLRGQSMMSSLCIGITVSHSDAACVQVSYCR